MNCEKGYCAGKISCFDCGNRTPEKYWKCRDKSVSPKATRSETEKV